MNRFTFEKNYTLTIYYKEYVYEKQEKMKNRKKKVTNTGGIQRKHGHTLYSIDLRFVLSICRIIFHSLKLLPLPLLQEAKTLLRQNKYIFIYIMEKKIFLSFSFNDFI